MQMEKPIFNGRNIQALGTGLKTEIFYRTKGRAHPGQTATYTLLEFKVKQPNMLFFLFCCFFCSHTPVGCSTMKRAAETKHLVVRRHSYATAPCSSIFIYMLCKPVYLPPVLFWRAYVFVFSAQFFIPPSFCTDFHTLASLPSVHIQQVYFVHFQTFVFVCHRRCVVFFYPPFKSRSLLYV